MINRIYYYMDKGEKKRIVPKSATWEAHRNTHVTTFVEYVPGQDLYDSYDKDICFIMAVIKKENRWYRRLWCNLMGVVDKLRGEE